MMRRWILPLLAATVVAIGAYCLTLDMIPRALMMTAVGRISSQGGVNHMNHAPLATDQSRTVVRPSPDLAYSVCPVDLSHGPVRVHADVPGGKTPYWSLSIFDAETNVAFVQNNAQSGGKPIDVTLAIGNSKVPGDVTVVRLRNPTAIALVRVLVPDRATFAALDRARQASFCGPVAVR